MVDSNKTAYKIILLAAAVAVAAFLIRETVDADTWWQVAIGRDILEHLAIPSVDRFSAAGWGRPYHDSHWLFQLLLAFSDRAAGMAGVSMVTALLWGCTLVVTYGNIRRWVDPATSAIMLFVVALACSDRFTPRPDIVTCLMISLFYRALLDEAYHSFRGLAALFMLQVVWANSHGLFVIGPFMAGCSLLASLPEAKVAPKRVGRAGILIVALLLASCLTPFGIDGWRYALLLATEAGAGAPEFFKRIAELAPTFGAASLRLADFWSYLLILVLAAAGCIPMLTGRRPDFARLLLVAGLCLAAFTGRRNMPLFVLAAAPFVAENFSLFMSDRRPRKALVHAAAAAMLATAVLPLSGRYYQWLGYPIRFGTGASPSYFPAALPPVLKTAGFKGQIYNANYLGGFLLYHGYLPLTDGRWELYDPKELDRIFSAPLDARALEYVLSRYSVTGILMQHTAAEAAPLLPRLAKDPGWRLVYLDHCASFWLKSDQRSSLANIDLNRPLAMDRNASRVEEYLMLGSFYKMVGSWSAAEAVARQGLAVGGKRRELLALLGGAQRDAGRAAAAEATFRELLREDPRDPRALNELAFFAYSRGDVASALQYLKRAAAVSPRDAAVRANIERIESGSGRR
jgi:tetratricopeptide (TPR) repeat protein